jgi:hypothetical protein
MLRKLLAIEVSSSELREITDFLVILSASTCVESIQGRYTRGKFRREQTIDAKALPRQELPDEVR